MVKTKIEWCDYSINPIKGLCPMPCTYCYAKRMYKRFKWNPLLRFDLDCMAGLPEKPSRIFVGSTMELFGDWVHKQWMAMILAMTQKWRNHTFIFLTKQPENLVRWSPFPDNCWVGVSATNQHIASAACAYLSFIKAKVRFLSIEPLLEWGDIKDCRIGWQEQYHDINWLIIGQQTPLSIKTKPSINWIYNILQTSNRIRIPVFLKDNLRTLVPSKEPFYTPVHWQEDGITMTENRLRQEYPKMDKI
jgi:protein gp37